MLKKSELETARLTLRRFAASDSHAFFEIMRDKEVNTYLPVFPLDTVEKAQRYLHEQYIEGYRKQTRFAYAVCLKSDDIPVGYVTVGGGDNRDLGYGLRRDYWRRGITSEACRAVVEQARDSGIPYLTATHDVNNPRSGGVMKNIGMTYRYSYEELWQPKNFLVTFRMYQINLDGCDDRVYRGYWDMYPVHFVEETP